jgi:predicted phosphodiesterase
MVPYKVIVLSDLQLPFEDAAAVNAVEQYMKKYRFDEWVQIGDFMDFNYISRWTEANLKVISGSTFVDDYKYANEFLDRQQMILRSKNPKCKMTIIQGNHDIRPDKVIEKDPRYEGMIEFDRNLKLRERNIKFVRFWEKGDLYTIGHASFAHGNYTNQYHAAKMVARYGTNIFYGHTHDVQQYSLVYKGKGKTLVGQSLGCLCRHDLSYVRGAPENWQQAFGVFYFFPNGDFSYYIPRIINGRFISPEGDIFEGKP